MLNLKVFTRISLIALLTLTVFTAPGKVRAQDDVSGDDETIVPPSTSSNGAPPVIIDESDSGGVSDVEEYDG